MSRCLWVVCAAICLAGTVLGDCVPACPTNFNCDLATSTCVCPAPLTGYYDNVAKWGYCWQLDLPTDDLCTSNDYSVYVMNDTSIGKQSSAVLTDGDMSTGVETLHQGQAILFVFDCIKHIIGLNITCLNGSCATLNDDFFYYVFDPASGLFDYGFYFESSYNIPGPTYHVDNDFGNIAILGMMAPPAYLHEHDTVALSEFSIISIPPNLTVSTGGVDPVSTGASSTGVDPPSSTGVDPASSTGVDPVSSTGVDPASSSSGTVSNLSSVSSSPTANALNHTTSSSATKRFVPPILDHDPFANGDVFDSPVANAANRQADLLNELSNDDKNWPSPVVDETDQVDVLATTQPTGGTTYFTPDIQPPSPDSTGVSSTGLEWIPVDTLSGISTGAETDIKWRFKQLKRRGQSVLSPQSATEPVQLETERTPDKSERTRYGLQP